ncbi:MAG: DM13 domain-containing protein [Acidobacteria bacterium]|nr:DM13 domain-containing protein [Acidobacteriota bacterium]
MRFFLCVLFLSGLAWGQMRIIPHVTSPNGGFTTQVMLTNGSDVAKQITVSAFDGMGEAIRPVEMLVPGRASTVFNPADVFETQPAHLELPNDTNVQVAVAYTDAAGTASPAHVPATEQTASRWRIFPGRWSDVIDGIALVNLSGKAISVDVRQRASGGASLSVQTVLMDVPDKGKGLLLLENFFSEMEGAFFDVEADGPVALTALRFSRGCPYFWQSAALPLPDSGERHPLIGKIANLQNKGNYGVSGSAEVLDEQTIMLRNFNYNGGGILVQIYAGMDGAYGNGFAISGDLISSTPYVNETMTLKIPAGHSLDEINGLSVWCVAVGADFGSGTFQ